MVVNFVLIIMIMNALITLHTAVSSRGSTAQSEKTSEKTDHDIDSISLNPAYGGKPLNSVTMASC
jgi:hypothetical protein